MKPIEDATQSMRIAFVHLCHESMKRDEEEREKRDNKGERGADVCFVKRSRGRGRKVGRKGGEVLM